MKELSEIYFTKKDIKKDEWLELIKTISNYHGLFRKWSIIVTIRQNQIRFFIKNLRILPTSIGNLNSFLFKPVEQVILPETKITLLHYNHFSKNIIDYIQNSEMRRKGTLECFEFRFRKLTNDYIHSSASFYLNQKNFVKKYRILFAISENLLSINFENNKSFFYKAAPKYLDIHKVLHLFCTDSNQALLKIDTFPYLQGDFYLSHSSFQFDKHSIIFGASGCGKSKFISLLIHNIYKNDLLRWKYKVVVIDPHASLEGDIGGLGKVIDFEQEQDSVDLFSNSSNDVVASTELLLDLFHTLMKDQYNSKLERVLRHSIHMLLTDSSFHFQNLRNVILDLEFRNTLIHKLKGILPTSVIDFFLSDFNELKTRFYTEAISPIIGFLDEMEMVPVFNQEIVKENLQDVIEDNFLTIFSLNRLKLGDNITKTISGLVMQQLFTYIQQREKNEHIIFIIDEVAIVENPILCRYLSESRKYNLSLILTGQYFHQISNHLKNAIFANVFNYFIFRVSKQDAITLVDHFNMSIPLDNTKEKKIDLLTELNVRECIVRISSNDLLLPAFKASTSHFQSIPRIKIHRESFKNKDIFESKKSYSFQINPTIRLKDILIKTSSSRKVIKDE